MAKTTTPLYLTPKMGLIPEVSAQNYDTMAKAIREYVSNALDARAKRVWITFVADADGCSQLDVRDDGGGMSLEQLRKEFLAVGGSKKFDDPTTVGRIGIGFLAIVPLCEGITVYTKAAESRLAVRATISTSTMLPVGVRYEEIATTQIGEAEEVSPEETARLVETWGPSFSSFSLEKLRGDVAHTFADDDAFNAFREELRVILPLPWPSDGPLKRVLSRSLWSAVTKKAAEQSIAVYLNNATEPLARRIYGENTTRENALYCQEFRNELVLAANAEIGQLEPVRVTGFFVCDEPGTETRAGFKLGGVITRVLNVAIDESTYFGLEGKEERKKRVAGELFIEGLDANKAIQLNRNAFTETHRPVQLFRREMSRRLDAFFSGMNRIWRARSGLNREVRRIRGIVDAVGSALESIGEEGSQAPRKASRQAAALMRHKRLRYFPMDPGGGLSLEISTDVENSGKTPYRIELKGDPQSELQGKVELSSELLDIRSRTYKIAGSEFGLVVVDATEADPPCAIDLRERFVVLNGAHPLIAGGESAVIEILIYLAFAVEGADTPRDLANTVTRLMSAARR